MVHIHCGDTSAEALRRSDVDGEVIVWTELLFDGPIRGDVDHETYLRQRATFLSKSTGGYYTPEQTENRLKRQDAALEQALLEDEIVLWFDACMYDQTILAHLLNEFRQHPQKKAQLALISVGTFPGKPGFRGLGELTPVELASLLPQRVPVTESQLQFAGDACAAIRSNDPRSVQAMLEQNQSPLPHLHGALGRFLEQFPSTTNGLSRLQQEILEEVAHGAQSPVFLFRALSEREENPFFGDTLVWKTVNGLCQTEQPALHLSGPGPLPLWDPENLGRWSMDITPTGSALLTGSTDWITANGIDTWIGGTHLTQINVWRWNTDTHTLVSP